MQKLALHKVFRVAQRIALHSPSQGLALRSLSQRLALRSPRLAPCIVSRRGCHAKAFASDTISVVFVLCLLFECVFKGDGRFARQARVCALMRESLDILLAGDKAVRLANRLDAVLEEFQIIALALYPWIAIPKMHLMRHIKDGLLHWERNMSCMPGERLHRRAKAFGHFAFNKWTNTILVRTLRSSVRAQKERRNFQHTRFEGKPKNMLVCGASTAAWRSARVGRINVVMQSVVYWTLPSFGLGRVRGVVMHEEKAFASVALLTAVADGCFEVGELDELLVECAVIEGSLAYIELAPDRIKVLMPA